MTRDKGNRPAMSQADVQRGSFKRGRIEIQKGRLERPRAYPIIKETPRYGKPEIRVCRDCDRPHEESCTGLSVDVLDVETWVTE